jgi:thiamine pyrophosphate-dependent acetolactate synthase large subunit-like protein
MARTAGDILVETLIDWGVDVVFGIPGDGINGIIEALRNRQDDIRFVQVRHEEAAAFMDCAHAKWTGRLGVCLAPSGPMVVQAVVDPNEPPMPPKVDLEQAALFAESLLRGTPNAGRIALTAASDRVRDMI